MAPAPAMKPAALLALAAPENRAGLTPELDGLTGALQEVVRNSFSLT